MATTTRAIILAVAAFGLMLSAAYGQEAEITPQAAANMASNCYACHGPQGRSPGTIPSLHNLTADYMITTLKQFKSGERPSTVMGRHAKGYSDAQLAAIANHIAGLKK
jgi:sulfide dehydrogenase cytochrome subunit